MKLKDTQILLTFPDKETADYAKLISRRKCVSLESYIIDNYEWDSPLECMQEFNNGKKVKWTMCRDCEYNECCPDAVKKK
ncbi:MAG: hypothetical protein PHC39_04935 [Proteiniphilum sp.]|nr:hypothetical protein [Proteiniphilum sp.]